MHLNIIVYAADMLGKFELFKFLLSSAGFFFKTNFFKIMFRVSNGLNTDQDPHSVLRL